MYWNGREMSKTDVIDMIIVHLWNLNMPRTVENVQGILMNHAGSLEGITVRNIEARLNAKKGKTS